MAEGHGGGETISHLHEPEAGAPDDTAYERQKGVINCPFKVGDHVYKITGDYTFEGVVVSVFTKLNPQHVRLVVEDDRGILHVYSAKNLALKDQ